MNKLEQLKEQLLIQEKLTRDLRNKVDDLEDKEGLPALKKKFEGKYFRCRNSYGGGGGKWWYYSYCRKVVKRNKFIIDSFQTTPDGKSEFHVNESSYETLLQQEITKKEYTDALKAFIKNVKKLAVIH